MANSQTFQAVNDEVLIDVINRVNERLVFVAPGVRPKVADAIVRAVERMPEDSASIVLDVSEEVCRMGMGDIGGLKRLQENERTRTCLSSQEGVRIGVLIADEDTLIYTPTALLLEAEPEVARAKPTFGRDANCEIDAGDKPVVKPNGILLRKQIPESLSDACSANGEYARREIGLEPIDINKVKVVESAIANNPPKPFDIQRKERVFSSELCYMELEFTGYRIATKKLELPPELFVFDKDTRKRLATKFQVFDKELLPKDVKYKFKEGGNDREVELSLDFIDQKIKDLRQDFLISTGRWGTVMKRERKSEFEDAVRQILDMLKTYKESITKSVTDIAKESCKKLADEVSEKLIKNPPLKWRNRLSSAKTDQEKKDEIVKILTEHFSEEIAKAIREFDPKVRRVEKGISYETFSDPEFCEKVEEALGSSWRAHVLHEHDSAPEIGA